MAALGLSHSAPNTSLLSQTTTVKPNLLLLGIVTPLYTALTTFYTLALKLVVINGHTSAVCLLPFLSLPLQQDKKKKEKEKPHTLSFNQPPPIQV